MLNWNTFFFIRNYFQTYDAYSWFPVLMCLKIFVYSFKKKRKRGIKASLCIELIWKFPNDKHIHWGFSLCWREMCFPPPIVFSLLFNFETVSFNKCKLSKEWSLLRNQTFFFPCVILPCSEIRSTEARGQQCHWTQVRITITFADVHSCQVLFPTMSKDVIES